MSERAALIPLIDALPDVRVLCVGDVMLDRYVYGTVERVSPEAPIPVLRVERETAMLGGAGNVIRNVLALGSRARLIATVGDDAAGATARRLLAAEDGSAFALITDPTRQTSIKTRFLAANQQILRADEETVAALAPGPRGALLEAVGTMLSDAQVVVLSDYGKGVLSSGIAAELIAAARMMGKPVIVDPKGREYARYAGASVVTPNRNELAEATGASVRTVEESVAAARLLLGAHGFGAVIATLGKDGMAVVTAAGEVHHLAAEAREVFDVSGAGDTVVAALAVALGAGADLVQAAALANVAAGIVVGKVGTAVAYRTEVVDVLRHQDLSEAEAKVMTLEPALDRTALWRRRGFRIGFTNGCFDLLHPGHVSLLAAARKSCDRLIVAINSDDSVRRLKGATRPIQSETARATVLASLASVDLVVIFSEDTPLKLIEAFRPDVLIKGADYRLEEVVGAEVVHSYGGEVRLARIEPGFSTTATIARLAE
jgi:D-beta-D-heptose 7-phosphate kinase / D-beta-D-heptose 1-phosphate adenosyltransferase